MRLLKFSPCCGDSLNCMSMKFGNTKGTKGLLKLTKFGVATLIFGDAMPQQYPAKQPKQARPVMHWLLANACVSSFLSIFRSDVAW